MGLNPRVLQQWTDMLGGVAVPPNIKAPPQAREQAVRIVRLLVDDDDLVALLEQQPRISSIDYILSLRIWQGEGIADALTGGLSGLMRFASIATPSEYISRARRMLTTTRHIDEPPLWQLPSYLTEQAAQAEQNWRHGFSRHAEDTDPDDDDEQEE